MESALVDGARCGAASWSEVAQKVLAAGRDWELVRALLSSYPLTADTTWGSAGRVRQLR